MRPSTAFSKFTNASRGVLEKNTFPLSKFRLRGATRTTNIVDLTHREE